MADDAAAGAVPIDSDWLRGNPLPMPGEGTDKNSRGRVLMVGGSRRVPGGLLLTAEAAFRAGAGKVQIATIESCAVALGIAMPEAGIIGLGEDSEGEIGAGSFSALTEASSDCDCLLLGPAMTQADAAGALLKGFLEKPKKGLTVLLDAAAIEAARGEEKRLRTLNGRLVLTPHAGEMAALLECEVDAVEADPAEHARRAVERFGAVVVMKGSSTVVAAPGGTQMHYSGGGVGLATGGSGDVLAGLIAALIARGCQPLTAASWGVWLHGEAGRRLAEQTGPIGFMARELPPLVPGLMQGTR